MASFEAVIGQSLLEHVKLRSSWMITVPSQNPNLSTTLLSSRCLRQLLQSPSTLSLPSDRSTNIGTSLPSGGQAAILTGRGFWLYPTSPPGSRPTPKSFPYGGGPTMHQPVIGPGESGPGDTEFDDIEWELCCSAREASGGCGAFANLDFARATMEVCRTRMEQLRRDSLIGRMRRD